LPALHISILTRPTGTPVGAEGEEIVPGTSGAAFGSRASIEIGLVPRIAGYGFAEVGATPVGWAWLGGRRGPERFESLFGRGVASVVEPICIERRTQHLYLRACRALLRCADVTKDVRGNEGGEHGKDDDDDENLDEGEAVALSHVVTPSDREGSGAEMIVV
jgi:hypothetical protein